MMSDNKIDDTDSDEDYQEVVVNKSDFRKEIYEFPAYRNLNVIKCIGQIESEYDYTINKQYKKSIVGTGTVYKAINGVAFVLTCAHNFRHKIYNCSKCNTYNMNKICSCGQILTADDKQFLKPTHIAFKRRNITNNNFGYPDCEYECLELYVPNAYESNATVHQEFDFAVLIFRDKDGYYSEHCRNITLDFAKKILKTYKRYAIFGYPGKDYGNALKDKLYGYAMKCDKKEKGFELTKCEEPNGSFSKITGYVLRQRHIDTSSGQSGAAVFVNCGNNSILFAVHVGGHKKKKKTADDYAYNVAVLLCKEYIQILNSVTNLDSVIKLRQKNEEHAISLQNEINYLKNQNQQLIKRNEILKKENQALNESQKINVYDEEKKNDKNYFFNAKELTDICIEEVIPQIGNKMLSENIKSIRSFLLTNNINSNKLFTMKPTELRDSLITHSSHDIKGGPANKLFQALKERMQQTILSIESIDTFQWGIHGGSMEINGKKVAFNNNGVGDKWNTVYSSKKLFFKSKRQIKIKVLKKNKDCFIAIGITSTSNFKNSKCFGKDGDSYNYGYSSGGLKLQYSNKDNEVKEAAGAYCQRDVILVCIDLDVGKMWFEKNYKKIYETNIKKQKYYLAICMYGTGSASIEIV